MKRATKVTEAFEMFVDISIHALVKRATTTGYILFILPIISIHALVKRATAKALVKYFAKIISIHALVKRATSTQRVMLSKLSYFNPRPREEGDAQCLHTTLRKQ